jgi:hypothetical protein
MELTIQRIIANELMALLETGANDWSDADFLKYAGWLKKVIEDQALYEVRPVLNLPSL